ncbi:MAG: phosphoribosylamine--glycine ligase [Propionibacteriaceae bacterium]|nr:phosphoribosylamine--glycine ligase [Propionibacteriaceae bacterium]
MTVLVVGSGGREHALASALARDPKVARVHVGPGNPGTWRLSQRYGLRPGDPVWDQLVGLDPLDGAAVVALARQLGAGLVVVGPEAPLVAGVADQVRQAGLACFGPSAEAARLEGSKQFAKQIMAAAGVPTARSYYCVDQAEAAQALDLFGPPYVVKNDGLASGKGVVVTSDRSQALAHAAVCGQVVIEEYLDGPEVSLFAISDGRQALPLIPAQDFKRVQDGDAGPNTGGMGAYAPLPWAPPDLVAVTMSRVIEPTIAELANRGTPFAGLLYAGLALTSRGLRVVEFNARFGDPETQAILPLLRTGLGQLLLAAAEGRLDRFGPLSWAEGASLTVVLAAQGYPGRPASGGLIAGPALTQPPPGVEIIQAGTALDRDGRLVAAGGRVLDVVARGADLAGARAAAYAAIAGLDAPSLFCRSDIALRAAQGLIGPVRPVGPVDPASPVGPTDLGEDRP